MRIGIFSDIHGNIYAFERVWKALLKESCDLYCCAGDVCGYYYFQNEVIDALQNIDHLVCVMGNHDKFFLDCLKDEKLLEQYSDKYGGSLLFLKETITEDNLQFLKNLPLSFEDQEISVAMFHASPWNPLEGYIYPTDSVEKFKDLSFRYVFLGHTHYPMHKQAGNVQVVNPGSVGQPRDYAHASFAVLDSERNTVDFQRVEYDIEMLIKSMKEHNEKNQYLFNVLGVSA